MRRNAIQLVQNILLSIVTSLDRYNVMRQIRARWNFSCYCQNHSFVIDTKDIITTVLFFTIETGLILQSAGQDSWFSVYLNSECHRQPYHRFARLGQLHSKITWHNFVQTPPPHPPLKFGNSHFEPGTPLTLKAGKEKKTTGKKRQVERLRVLFSDWNVLRYTAGGKNQRKSCCFFLPTATDLQFNSSSISSAFGITLSIGIMTKSMHSEG